MIKKRKEVKKGRKPLPDGQRKATQAVTLTPAEAQQVRDEIEIRVRQGEIRMTESEMSRHLIRIGLGLIAFARDSETGSAVLDVVISDLATQEAK